MPPIALPPAVESEFARIRAAGLTVGVALSAGADSTLALLLTVERLGPASVIALHYDHALRGPASEADARAAADLSAALGVRHRHATRATAGAHASEAALRADRLAFLRDCATAHDLAAIVTGHHADDLAETFLMRLARGSGTDGLSAPRPVSRHADGLTFLRPLLHTAKQAVIAELLARGVAWREDASNTDPLAATRNAVRLRVTPHWRAHAGPAPLAGAIRSRELLQEDADALALWTESAERTLAPGTAGEDWSHARTLPRAILRRLLHRRLLRLGAHGTLGATAFDTLLDHIAAGTPHTAGALRFDGRTFLSPAVPSTPREHAMLPVPGAVFWPDGAHLHAGTDTGLPADAVLHLADEEPLHCAPPAPGARYRQKGASGSAKISDMLINRKIPRHTRPLLPVITDRLGPLWAPGLVPAERVAKSTPATRPLRLTWHPPRAP